MFKGRWTNDIVLFVQTRLKNHRLLGITLNENKFV